MIVSLCAARVAARSKMRTHPTLSLLWA
jgi:hypothetical protein